MRLHLNPKPDLTYEATEAFFGVSLLLSLVVMPTKEVEVVVFSLDFRIRVIRYILKPPHTILIFLGPHSIC